MKKTERAAFGGILAALSAAVLIFGGMLPSFSIAAAAIAGLLPAAAVLRSGGRFGLGAAVFAVSGLLGLLLAPDKTAAVWYLAFFGWYGLLKSLAERGNSRVFEWAIKLSAYTAAFFLLKLVLRRAFAALTDLLPAAPAAVFFIGMAALILYDIGYSRLIGLYLRRIGRNFGKGEPNL